MDNLKTKIMPIILGVLGIIALAFGAKEFGINLIDQAETQLTVPVAVDQPAQPAK